jgi:hypothetical protein
LRKCSSLSSICVPSSLERVPQYCFSECDTLSTVAFECDSRISRTVIHS